MRSVPGATPCSNPLANRMETRIGQGTLCTSAGEWIGLVSGLDIGLPGPSAAEQDATDMSLQLLVEYLASEAGGVEVNILFDII